MSMSVTFKNPQFYEELVDEHEIFEYRRDVVMFMAVLGYAKDNLERDDYRGSGDNQGNTRIESFYSRDLYQVIGGSLAYQHTSDPDALVDLELQAKIISQYAAGGLEIARQEFGDVAGDPTDAIVNYINELEEEDDTEDQVTLDDIMQDFDRDMLGTDAD